MKGSLRWTIVDQGLPTEDLLLSPLGCTKVLVPDDRPTLFPSRLACRLVMYGGVYRVWYSVLSWIVRGGSTRLPQYLRVTLADLVELERDHSQGRGGEMHGRTGRALGKRRIDGSEWDCVVRYDAMLFSTRVDPLSSVL